MPLRIHFLNVGRGDCTIIEFPSGRVGMVDVCNLKDLDTDTWTEGHLRYLSLPDKIAYFCPIGSKLTDPLEYYSKHIGEHVDIFRLIITHPNMDHMSGLSLLYDQKKILNFWHIGLDDFNLANTNWNDAPYDKKDWEIYKELRASKELPKNIRNMRGDRRHYWTEDNIEILSPTEELIKAALDTDNPNIASIVLKITYCGKSIILGGDATADQSWPDIYENCDLSGVSILKASHHGRKSGYHWPSIKKMSPYLTITSVPGTQHDATENYRRYSQYTASLRDTGSFYIEIDHWGDVKIPPEVMNKAKPMKKEVTIERFLRQLIVSPGPTLR